MATWALALVYGFSSVVFAGQNTDEDLAHYVKKEPSTDMPWTSNERRINKMILEEIEKFNYAPETTECPFDSQGKPKPTESRQPLWWNAYRQAKDGDRPDWSAEIRELVKQGGRTYPPWTPSQESEPAQSRFKTMEPFTWRPGAPVINVRIKTDATTRPPSGPTEPTTERSITLASAQWDTSEEGGGGGGGGTEPPLNLASLQKGYKEKNEHLQVRPRKTYKRLNTGQSPKGRVSKNIQQMKNRGKTLSLENQNQHGKASINKKDENMQLKLRLRRERARRTRQNALGHILARV